MPRPRPTIDRMTADAVIDCLLSRAGFDEWWCVLPEEIQDEILEALADAIWEVLEVLDAD